MQKRVEKVIIMGAAGRDFHNFNVYFGTTRATGWWPLPRPRFPTSRAGCYPPELAGALYPEGIPIYPEERPGRTDPKHQVDLVAFSYSDVPHEDVMHMASLVMAAGADFILIGRHYTMLTSAKPVVSVCAVRTGCGKTQTTRKVVDMLQGDGQARWWSCATPCPMATCADRWCSVLPPTTTWTDTSAPSKSGRSTSRMIDMGIVVYAGVDYEKILRAGRERGRRHRLGRRQQRHALLPARSAHRSLRSPPPRARNRATTPARPTCSWPTWP